MAQLEKARHERFAQGIAAGKPAAKAYAEAGFSARTARVSAYKLLASKHARIRDRVAEILREREQIDAEATRLAIERIALTKERVALELAKIGFANMLDYMKVTPSGYPVIDFSRLSCDQAAALHEITVDEYMDDRGDERTVKKAKFKLADKRAALMDIAKLFGWIIERREQKNVSEFEKMTDEELDAEIARMAAKHAAAGGIGARRRMN